MCQAGMEKNVLNSLDFSPSPNRPDWGDSMEDSQKTSKARFLDGTDSTEPPPEWATRHVLEGSMLSVSASGRLKDDAWQSGISPSRTRAYHTSTARVTTKDRNYDFRAQSKGTSSESHYSPPFPSFDAPESVALKRAMTVERVRGIIRRKWGPDYDVKLFGSTQYGVDKPTSDLDLVILVSPGSYNTMVHCSLCCEGLETEKRIPAYAQLKRSTWSAKLCYFLQLDAYGSLQTSTTSGCYPYIDSHSTLRLTSPFRLVARQLSRKGFQEVQPIPAAVPIG
jgi:predicted nucleotidyltransferase